MSRFKIEILYSRVQRQLQSLIWIWSNPVASLVIKTNKNDTSVLSTLVMSCLKCKLRLLSVVRSKKEIKKFIH